MSVNRKFLWGCSILSSVSLIYTIPISEVWVLASSIIPILLIYPIFLLLNSSLEKANKESLVISSIISLFMSTAIKLGRDLSLSGSISLSIGTISKNFVIILGVFMILVAIINEIILKVSQLDILDTEKKQKRLKFPILWLLIFVVWLPMLLAFYPGIFSYDAPMQFQELANLRPLTTHHPLIHNFLLNIVLIIGDFTGSYSFGALFYILIQMFVMSGVFSFVCYTLGKHNLKKSYYLTLIIYFSLFPLNLLFPLVATKDTLFSAFFLLFTVLLFESFNSRDFFDSKKNILLMVMAAILVGVFRNNAVYAMLATTPFIFIFVNGKKLKRYLTFVFIVSSLFTICFTKSMAYVSNAKPGMEGQMYSLPIQQLARTFTLEKEHFSKKDREVLYKYIPGKYLERYNPRISDYVKSYFTLKGDKASSKEFLILWGKIGRQYPKHYLDATLMMTQGYWDPNFQFPDQYYKLPIIELWDKETGISDKQIVYHSFIPELKNFFKRLFNDATYRKIPILSIFFSSSFIMWIISILLGISIYKKQKKILFGFTFIFLYLGTLILGPVMLVRYSYPFILCWPIIFCYIGIGIQKDNSQMSPERNEENFSL